MEQDFATTASLIAEPTRAVMLLKLLNGQALPAGELAMAANISPQTASGHLTKLLDAQFLTVETQGRHRYYRLAGVEVAHALEAMLVLLPQSRNGKVFEVKPDVGTLAFARTCYSHLAGWLGVKITERLVAEGHLLPGEKKRFVTTVKGRAWFEALGVDLSNAEGRQCLDWTERRHHIAGPLGVALYRRLIELEWIVPLSHARGVRVSLRGRRELWSHLKVPLG